MNPRTVYKQHIKTNLFKYLLMIVIFGLGIAAGEFKSGDLGAETRNHLLGLIDQMIQQGIALTAGEGALLSAAASQIKTAALMWFLGMTVVGVPLILGLVFARAFSLGFTLGFLAEEKGSLGVLMGISSVIPQNLIYVPFLLTAAVVCVNFSLFLVRGRFYSRAELWQNFVLYTLVMIGITFMLLVGAVVESYLSPWLLSLVLS
ncbi:MAG: stage II sporulation protein M [Syntrophomonadaceae bacterium]|nr:stage II sporulation protein M [Syntrophomonadaceae bacterium]